MKKYELTEETKVVELHTLHRIRAIIDFCNVKQGDLGGWIEHEDNLDHVGDAWVSGNAWVYGNAEVSGNARVYGNAEVSGNAWVYGDAEVSGNARVYGNADYIVFKNWWSSGRYFTWTRSNNMWRVGCFYGTAEELVKKAYKDSERSGREYERVVRYVESILEDEKKTTKNQ